ncbi:MAG: glycosyltransferase family 4 protein [Chloroflexi bacterium]|nr:glycosyltransferase family 4 protein [Chloroflexota bacterium]
MRIAIDVRLVSYAQGGISQYTIRLVRALVGLQSGDELLLLESRKAPTGQFWPAAVRRSRLATPPHHPREQIALPIELLRLPADVLHSPDFIPPFRRRCRSVVTIHDLAFLRFPHLLTPDSGRYYGQVARAVQSADQVIAVSHATKRDLLELLSVDPEKVTVVHSGVSPECRPLEPEEIEHRRRELGLPERFILFVGTLEPRKNLPTLLRAFARVWKAHRVPLVVVGGKGWLNEELFRVREELGLGEEVKFVGSVAAQQLVYYYNCATCLVLPSLYEGFGHPVLEAMACGTPAIVSNVPSLTEIAGDAALSVGPEDAEELAAAMGRLLADGGLRQRLIGLGLQRAAAFSWEQTARETLGVYHKAVQGSR